MKIVVLDAETIVPEEIDWQPLRQLGCLELYADTSPEEFASRVKDADVVLTNKVPIGKPELTTLQNCKLIGVLATGVNVLDLPTIKAAGIPVCNTSAYGVEDVAQHALALLLELAKNTRLHSESVLADEWQQRNTWCYWLKTPLGLQGLTLGIIGFGGIGQMLGKYAHALGMKVLANARHHNAQLDYPFEYVDQDTIFISSNVISLHCPLTEQTEKLINAANIAKMQPGSIIINTARGGLVDENAVAEALKTGKLRGYGADVLSTEPPLADNPLLSAPNVLLTPHMAWATLNARQKIVDIMAANIAGFMQGMPENMVIG